MLEYRSQRVALALSVLIHILILAAYRPLARIHLFPDRSEAAQAVLTEPLFFELVETPDDAVRKRPEAATLLSDKNAIARNEERPADKPTGEAYSEGEIAYRVFSGRPEPSGDRADQSPAEQAEKPQEEPRDDIPADEMDHPILDLYSLQRKSTDLRLDTGALSQLERGPLSTERRFTDDLDYDQRDFSAEVLGGITLNTYEWDFAFYILDMKRRLKDNTFPPLAFTRFGMISGETVLTFRVLPDGNVLDVAVVDYRGHRTLMETSVDAVKNAAPFRPLPQDFPEDYLELRWTFVYYVIR